MMSFARGTKDARLQNENSMISRRANYGSGFLAALVKNSC